MKKLVFYEINDLYFFYGVYTSQEFKYIALSIEFFNLNLRNIHPTFDKLSSFSIILNLIEGKKYSENINS